MPIKANTTVTAKEVIEELGSTEFLVGEDTYKIDELFGKVRVRIGGLTGIANSDHLIAIPADAKELDVIIGVERYVVKLGKSVKEKEHSDKAVSAKKAQVSLIKAQNLGVSVAKEEARLKNKK